MPKYVPSDDDKVIDGKIVVFLNPTQWRGATSTDRLSPAERALTAKAQAAAPTAAAQKGVPLLRGVRTRAPSSNGSKLKIWR
jgi:hypothetical protein